LVSGDTKAAAQGAGSSTGTVGRTWFQIGKAGFISFFCPLLANGMVSPIK